MHNWIEYLIDLALFIALLAVVNIGNALSSFAHYFAPSFIVVSLQSVHDNLILVFQTVGAGALCGIAIYRFIKELKKKD